MDPSLSGARHQPPARPPAPAEIKAWYARANPPRRNLAVHGIGVREWMAPGFVDRPRGTGDWLLMAWHQDVRFAAGAAPTAGPCLMLWSPDHGHFYGRADRAWNHSWIHCDGAAVRGHVAASGLPLGEPIAPVAMPLIERHLADIHHEVSAHAEPDETIVGNLLHNLLRHLARGARSRGAPVPPRLLAVRRHLETAFAAPLALTELAAMAGCSVGHFCAGFKRWFGVSAIDYAITLRLERARTLLADRNLSVHAVARAVGYEDLHHFSKLFRKRMGKPPSALRERCPLPIEPRR